MLASDLNALLYVPGRLCLNPTDLSQAFPYGGTDLGLVARIKVRPGKAIKRLREENLGRTVAYALDMGEAWAMAAAVRYIEQGHAGTFFTTETGASSGEPRIAHNPTIAGKEVGQPLANVAVLFAPFDELQQFFVYFPAAVAFPDAAAEEEKSISRPGITLVGFDATPRASDGYAVIKGKKEDMSL